MMTYFYITQRMQYIMLIWLQPGRVINYCRWFHTLFSRTCDCVNYRIVHDRSPRVRIMADRGTSILVIVGKGNKLCFNNAKDMFKFMLIIEINHVRQYEAPWEAFRAQFCQRSEFWKADFQGKNQINGKW